MKRQVRRGAFETNSSSTHALVICSEEEFNAWERGELLFDEWGDKFVSAIKLSDREKRRAEEDYENNKTEFQKDWEDLSENAKLKYYAKFATDNGIINGNIKTYREYMEDYDLETFVQRYTSKSNDKIVAFGKYGYN